MCRCNAYVVFRDSSSATAALAHNTAQVGTGGGWEGGRGMGVHARIAIEHVEKRGCWGL